MKAGTTAASGKILETQSGVGFGSDINIKSNAAKANQLFCYLTAVGANLKEKGAAISYE